MHVSSVHNVQPLFLYLATLRSQLLIPYSRTMAGSSVSWEELLSGIREAFSSQNVDIDGVKQLMSSYHSRREDWQQYAKFDTHRLAALSLKNVLWSCRTCSSQSSSGTRGIWRTKAMAATTSCWCAGGRDTPRKLSRVFAVWPPCSPLTRRCCASVSRAEGSGE